MLLAGFVLFSSALLNTKPAPVFADVLIGDSGPYRFLVDTGSQTSLIEPALAAKLHLEPTYRVEVLTQNTTRLLPALRLRTLRIGPTQLPDMEIVFHDLGEARRFDPSVVGLLGINALAHVDFALLPASGRLEITDVRPSGEVVPFSRVEDRIAIKARMGREDLTFILDSGATHVVLFRTPEAMAKTRPVPVTFGTLEGARRVVPTTWTANMEFTRAVQFKTLPAAVVERPGTQVDGLVPAALFKAIYVDHARGEVVLVR